MITRLTGMVNRVLEDEIRLQVGPIEYQVLVPECVRRQLQTRTGDEVTLYTMQYLEGGQMSNRCKPRWRKTSPAWPAKTSNEPARRRPKPPDCKNSPRA